MKELLTPSGPVQVLEEGEEAPLTPYENASLNTLGAIARMLDLLVRLECGALKRIDLKKDILEAEQAVRDFQKNAIAEAAEAEFARLAEEEAKATGLVEAIKAGD